MDDRLCDTSRAYGQPAPAELSPVQVYEQLRDAVGSLAAAASSDQVVVAVWHTRSGGPCTVTHVGYYQQSFIVLSGIDDAGERFTALVSPHSLELMLKKVARTDASAELVFMGHALEAAPPAG